MPWWGTVKPPPLLHHLKYLLHQDSPSPPLSKFIPNRCVLLRLANWWNWWSRYPLTFNPNAAHDSYNTDTRNVWKASARHRSKPYRFPGFYVRFLCEKLLVGFKGKSTRRAVQNKGFRERRPCHRKRLRNHKPARADWSKIGQTLGTNWVLLKEFSENRA